MSKLKIGQVSPDFEITDIQGNMFKLSDFRGQANVLVVLNRGFT